MTRSIKVRFGARLPVSGPLASPGSILTVGKLADELGFDAVTAHDHVGITNEQKYHNSGGTAELLEERERQGLPVTDLYETLTTFSVIAGETTKVRMIPTSAVLPWRHPVLFAKQAVTLHELSGGRFVCSVVVGNITSDFKMMNTDFTRRGVMFDEYLEVLKLAFAQTPGSFKGGFIEFSNEDFKPRPSRKLPMWIGGSFREKVFERIAKFADGFLTSGSPASYEEGIGRLEEVLRRHGRSLSSMEIGAQTFMCLMNDRNRAEETVRHTVEQFFHGKEWANQDLSRVRSAMDDALVGTADDLIKKIDRYAEAHLNFFDLRLINNSLDGALSMMKLFAKDVMPSFD